MRPEYLLVSFMSQIENKMPQEHPRKLSKLLMILICLLLSFCMPFLTCSERDYGNTPVFFVHGYGMSAKFWEPIISYLTRHGYPRRYLKAINLRPNNSSNIVSAEKQIAPAIEELLHSINMFLKKNYPAILPKTKVDLISHSMGALSARWYAAKVRPDRVRNWISLGGANHGTDALCGWESPGADDLCPAFAENPKESLIQYELNGAPREGDVDETPYGLGRDSPGVDSIHSGNSRSILYISIRTTPDKWIKPENSAILDGTGGLSLVIPESVQAKETSPGNILMTNGVGHDPMLKCPDTIRVLAAILNQAPKK